MKDLIKEIKAMSKNKFNTSFIVLEKDTDEKSELKLMVLLSKIEESLKESLEVIQNVAPHYDKVLKKIDFERLGKAFTNDEVEFECRFYGIDKRSVELRVFVRTINNSGKTNKIAKVSYIYEAIYKRQTAA